MRIALALIAIALFAQDEGAAVLQGIVRNSQGQPVSGTAVHLTNAGKTLTAVTDSKGTYSFRALHAGTYTLRSGDVEMGPFTVAQGEARNVDLTIGSSAKAQFFDQPTFIVAGVTDPAARGGHGSDPVYRSAGSLTKEAASLRTDGTARKAGGADLHHALADKDENQGNSLDAVREYQRAAELDISEANLFDWAVELLKHRAADQSAEIFVRANRLYPRSTRILLGLAVALYARGSNDQARQRFFEAADLNPDDPIPYLFLGKLPEGVITESAGFEERMERFAQRLPENPQANYYYAASLWKRRQGDPATTARVQSLLEKAVHLDPHFGAAFLLLGTVLAEQGKLPEAISAYQHAIAAGPPTADAHYRLAQVWRRTGEAAKARREIEIYRQLSQQSALTSERERSDIQEFVFSLRNPE